jgi:hypothetical protein
MQTDTWLDKTTWGDGPWQDEPDRIEWKDPVTGYPCLMLRHAHFGNWCGYVAVPPGHVLHGADWNAASDDVASAAHSGLTFASGCMDDDRPKREQVCHAPAPGEPDNVWWFGFDCAHIGDQLPGMPLALPPHPGHRDCYRDAPYVTERCTALAAALAAAVTATQGPGELRPIPSD